MLGIILCDDDKFILEIEKEKITQLITKHNLQAYLACASTSHKEVLKFARQNPDIYLYFMDLDFGRGNLNGIDLAKLVKRMEPLSKIVFVTNHHEMALEVLKSGVEPFGFIEKSADMEGMNRSYVRYIRLALGMDTQQDTGKKGTAEEPTVLLMPGGGETLEIPLSNILYVEAVKTVSHCICYHTLDQSSITVRDSIEHAGQQLGEGFLRSHRSVLVNKKYIVGLEDGMIRFAGGQTAACSFRQRNLVKEVLYGRNV